MAEEFDFSSLLKDPKVVVPTIKEEKPVPDINVNIWDPDIKKKTLELLDLFMVLLRTNLENIDRINRQVAGRPLDRNIDEEIIIERQCYRCERTIVFAEFLEKSKMLYGDGLRIWQTNNIGILCCNCLSIMEGA